LDDLTARVAGWLRGRGVEAGDRIGLMLPNVPAFVVLYYGVLRAGATVVPMNPLLKGPGRCGTTSATRGRRWSSPGTRPRARPPPGPPRLGAETVTVTADTLDEVASWPPHTEFATREDEDTAVILYTSGTTGTPKGAQLTHANLRANAAISASSLFGVTQNDVIMGCLPLFHAFGQTCALNVAVLAGAGLTLISRFDPVAALNVIERDGVSVFMGVPTMYVAMLHAGPGVADTSTLRLCVSGGAALPVEVLTGFGAEFGARILEGYGLSETSPVASFNRVDNAKPGSIGFPIDGVEMRVVDADGGEVPCGESGEILIRGHNVMRGYWNKPEETAGVFTDGWFHSGDVGRRDEDGFFYIVDRKKDMIIRGGFNVYPREIEEVLYEHPAVLEAAVIGVPHPTHGEEVAAAVVLKPGTAAGTDELRDYVKARVAPYKYPRHVWLLEALPKGPTGKILKREIKPPEGAR
jgi:long-chain acyl-CoA synthetase